MTNLEFRDPWFLIFALLVPVAFLAARRTSSVLRYSSLSLVDAAPRSLRVRLAIVPPILLATSLLCFVIALAGPRLPDSETRFSREGIAIMMVVDHSGSMQARDLVEDDRSVDRLSVVKEVFRDFVLGGNGKGGRTDDAVGLISFAGYADSLCPLTNDHGSLTAILSDVEIVNRRDEDGTAIGDGLALAVERLRRSEAKSKVVILLTDGVSNAGIISPDQAADIADASGVKVYCIGAGTRGQAPFPFIDPFSGRTRLRLVPVELDEDTLREIAEKTGGRYFRATDRTGLAEVYAEIDRLEKTKVLETKYLRYDELYQNVVLAGLGLLGLALISRASVFRTLP